MQLFFGRLISKPTLLATTLAGCLLCVAAGDAAEDFAFEIADGPYEPSRESFAKHYQCPDWFRDAKFGIYMHWGLNSVSGANGHYARYMYHQQMPEAAKLDAADRAAGRRSNRSGWKTGGDNVYEYHVRKFGHPSKFGYKDFIPLFTAEKFDANALAEFYRDCGAKYVGVMAVHHDNFDLFDSTHQPWNSVRMGPKRDVVGEWQAACKQQGLRFAVTNHMNDGHDHAFFQGEHDTTGPLAGVAYDTLDPANFGLYGYRTPDRLRRLQPAHSQNWYRRIKEMVDRYEPDLIFLDGGLSHKEYGLNFAAHYYNQSLRRGTQGIITIKNGHTGKPTPGFTLDIESGAINRLLDEPWQVDTTINPGWFYLGAELVPTGRNIKSPDYNPAGTAQADEEGQAAAKTSLVGADRVRLTGPQVIDNLVDAVSKNGTMMLNVGLRPDGSLPETFRNELMIVGEWLKANGEAIYGTRPWQVFGEGPTEADLDQGYNDASIEWTAGDIRFTTKAKLLYVTLLDRPTEKTITIKLLTTIDYKLTTSNSVSLLATGQPLAWQQSDAGLTINLPETMPGKHAFVLKIE